jgi:CheY-like chemotaxis protein
MNKIFTILLAEDDEADLFQMRRGLQRAGIFSPVMNVQNGKEAVAYLKGEAPYTDRKLYPFPDILLLDLKMPVMDGFEVLIWVRSNPEMNLLPIIVLSSSDLQRDVDRAYGLGANAYLVKTADTIELGKMLQNLFNFWQGSAHLPAKSGQKLKTIQTDIQP